MNKPLCVEQAVLASDKPLRAEQPVVAPDRLWWRRTGCCDGEQGLPCITAPQHVQRLYELCNPPRRSPARLNERTSRRVAEQAAVASNKSLGARHTPLWRSTSCFCVEQAAARRSGCCGVE